MAHVLITSLVAIKRTMEGILDMADDRMKNDEARRNMGTGGREDQDFGQGQQSPGRNPQGGQKSGQPIGDQQGGQKKDNLNMDDDDEFGGGTSGQRGGRGGQNR